MAKRREKPKSTKAKRTPAITAKRVQDNQDRPPPIPPGSFTPHAESDDDPWGDDGLTVRQRLFVAALVGPAGGNATRAAEMAGYAADNRDSLRATAAENLSKPNVQQAIAHALTRLRLTPAWATNQLVDMASASMANFVTVGPDGRAAIDFGKAAAMGALGQIKEIREEVLELPGGGGPTVIKRTIKVHDRTKALGLLLRYHGLVDGEPEDADAVIRIRAGVNRRPAKPAADGPDA